MKLKTSHRLGAAALVFVVCIATAPVASAKVDNEFHFGFGERIVRVIKKIQAVFRPANQQDAPLPPRP